MQALDQVTVIVVTYHSAHCLNRLDSLLRDCPFVIVSDNASNDDTPAQAQALWPHAVVLKHEKNLGFGAANNRALTKVCTPFSLLLNPDCEISINALMDLLAYAKSMPDVAVLAPQIMSANGVLDVNYRWPNTLWKSKGDAAQGPVCVGFVCGAVMLLRMRQFESTGFFDEQFFLYYEDDDLCLRLFNERKQIVLFPDVRALHRSRGSVQGKSPWRSEFVRGFHHAQSKLIYARKHRSVEISKRLRIRLIMLTAIALPFRLVIYSPKHFARMLGRWIGLMQWKSGD